MDFPNQSQSNLEPTTFVRLQPRSLLRPQFTWLSPSLGSDITSRELRFDSKKVNVLGGVVKSLELFTAGTNTSATAVEFAISEMMRHPRVMEKVQLELRQVLRGKDRISESDLEGMRYMKMVIKETLRLHPPVPLLVPRVCREHREIDGYDIPMIFNAFAINKDPEYWDDAESFKAERFADSDTEFIGPNFEFLPLGGGRRICPNISFGLASVTLLCFWGCL